MPETILVTGAAGFIGSHVSRALCRRDALVVGLDALETNYAVPWKLRNVVETEKCRGFNFVRADILDQRSIAQLAVKYRFDAVVHLAARVGVRPSIDDPHAYADVNVRGTINVLETARQFGIRKVVFASSSSVYGNQTKIPFSETDSADSPISPYAATKRAGEHLCFTYAHLHGLSVTCLRFFTVYGPRGRPDMAPYLFTEAAFHGRPIRCFGSGETGRDYTYIDDIVSGVMAAINYFGTPFEIINLGNSRPVALRDLIAEIEGATGRSLVIERVPEQAGDVAITYADIAKARSLLGYEPRTTLQTGIRELVEWYRSTRFAAVASPAEGQLA